MFLETVNARKRITHETIHSQRLCGQHLYKETSSLGSHGVPQLGEGLSMSPQRNIIIGQPCCPTVGRRPQHVTSKLACIAPSCARSCHSSRKKTTHKTRTRYINSKGVYNLYFPSVWLNINIIWRALETTQGNSGYYITWGSWIPAQCQPVRMAQRWQLWVIILRGAPGFLRSASQYEWLRDGSSGLLYYVGLLDSCVVPASTNGLEMVALGYYITWGSWIPAQCQPVRMAQRWQLWVIILHGAPGFLRSASQYEWLRDGSSGRTATTQTTGMRQSITCMGYPTTWLISPSTFFRYFNVSVVSRRSTSYGH